MFRKNESTAQDHTTAETARDRLRKERRAQFRAALGEAAITGVVSGATTTLLVGGVGYIFHRVRGQRASGGGDAA